MSLIMVACLFHLSNWALLPEAAQSSPKSTTVQGPNVEAWVCDNVLHYNLAVLATLCKTIFILDFYLVSLLNLHTLGGVCARVSPGVQGVQKRASELLGPELQVVVSCQTGSRAG